MTISTVKYTKLFISVKYNNIIIIKFNLILRKRRYMCTFNLPPFGQKFPISLFGGCLQQKIPLPISQVCSPDSSALRNSVLV